MSSPMKRPTEDEKAGTRAIVRDEAVTFERAVLAAIGAGSPHSSSFIHGVRTQFTSLEQSVDRAASRMELKQIEGQAETLALLKAYLRPRSEIAVDAEAALQTMLGWSVPPETVEALRKQVAPCLVDTADLEVARGALYSLLKEMDSWSDYVDDYDRDMQRYAQWLGALIAVTLLGAVALVAFRPFVLDLLLAGACGALVSVIAKLPAFQVSGDAAPYKRGILRRVFTGLIASVVGVGLLVSGVITISVPGSRTIAQVVQACAPLSPAPSPASSVCQISDALILIAITMVFGLSERALTSFEDRVLPQKS